MGIFYYDSQDGPGKFQIEISPIKVSLPNTFQINDLTLAKNPNSNSPPPCSYFFPPRNAS